MDSQDKLTPALCAKGCGFFGSPENKNLCSKCYKDYLKEEVITKTADKLSELVITPSSDDKNPAVVSNETVSTTTTTASSTTVLKNRCECCGKKVGLMGFKCRCGKTFCGVHRYAKEHSCTFDFKTFDRQILAKQNPLVAGDKLDARI
jgi:predicted nucleic acid binding AN1-type Zn finger protein